MYTRNVLNLDNMDKKKSMYDFISINKKIKLMERERKVVVHHKLPTLVLCCIAVVVGSYSFEMSTQRSN